MLFTLQTATQLSANDITIVLVSGNIKNMHVQWNPFFNGHLWDQQTCPLINRGVLC